MKKVIFYFFIISFFIATVGCQKYLQIESDTSWSGAINNTTVEGSGNRDIDMDENSCAVFQKETMNGSLKITVKGNLFGGEDAHTTAEYGVVSVCAGDGL